MWAIVFYFLIYFLFYLDIAQKWIRYKTQPNDNASFDLRKSCARPVLWSLFQVLIIVGMIYYNAYQTKHMFDWMDSPTARMTESEFENYIQEQQRAKNLKRYGDPNISCGYDLYLKLQKQAMEKRGIKPYTPKP
jgi:hypothetical protein